MDGFDLRNDDTTERALRLRQMIAAHVRNMPDPERDRMMQCFLAQSRGSLGNIILSRKMLKTIMRIREGLRHARTDNA